MPQKRDRRISLVAAWFKYQAARHISPSRYWIYLLCSTLLPHAASRQLRSIQTLRLIQTSDIICFMGSAYVHGYDPKESRRLQDQASTLVELLHSDTSYPAGSRVLEAGCGVGAQTLTLSQNSPGASIISLDISRTFLLQARGRAREAGLENVDLLQADIFHLPFEAQSFDHLFLCFILEHLPGQQRLSQS